MRKIFNFSANSIAVPFKAQNLLEFIFILPLLVFITLAIFEVALFWQDVNAVYNLNAEINAKVALINFSGDDGLNINEGDICPAADESNPNSAISTLKKRDSMISLNHPDYLTQIADGTNSEPFSLYKIYSSTTVNGNPQITLWVDCRNPFEDGVTTQIEFYHKTMIMRASIPRFDDPNPIVIIPDNIFIASPKLNTLRHY